MKYGPSDLRLLAELATLLRRANPIPASVLADAEAAGLRLSTNREPRLANRRSDLAWLLPLDLEIP
jgi:hypothetical protein